MQDGELGQWDKKLLEARRSGGIVDLSAARQAYLGGNGEEPKLDAGLFRTVSSGLPAPGESAPEASHGCGRWHIRGASFTGQVNLSDCKHISGGELPALDFEDCSFPKGFYADDTTIRRLSFSRCRFGVFTDQFGRAVSLSLRNGRLQGDLQMRGLSSLCEDKLLIVSASGLRVEGGVELSDCELCAPPEKRTRADERAEYALSLNGAEIRSDLRLYPKVKLHGGIALRGSRIGGDLSLSDLDVSDGLTPESRKQMREAGLYPRFAIDATSSHVAGNLFFVSAPDLKRSAADGPVDFYGTTIEGSVVLGAAQFEADGSDYAFSMVAGHITGNVIAAPETRKGVVSKFTVKGVAQFEGLRVGGDVSLNGTATALDAPRVAVDGDTYLGMRVTDHLKLGGANLKGRLDLSWFTFSTTKSPGVPTQLLSLKEAEIGHTLYLANSPSNTPLAFQSCQRTEVRCYRGYYIFSIRLDQGTASILWRPGAKPQLLDGVSSYLHDLSWGGAVDLSTPEARRDYVRFFGAYVWGEEGPFAIVEHSSQLPEGSTSGLSEGQIAAINREMQLDSAFSEQDWKSIEENVKSNLGEKLTSEEWARYKVHFQQYGVRVQTHVRYGAQLFGAKFAVLTRPLVIEQSDRRASGRIKDYVRTRLQPLLEKGSMWPYQAGYILMIDDDRIGPLDPTLLPLYERPLIRRRTSPSDDTDSLIADYKSDLESQDFSRIELTLRIPDWQVLLERRLARFQNAVIDLTNASCKTLEDADGRAWGPDISELKLENFTYGRIGTPDSEPTSLTLTPLGRALVYMHKKKDRIGKAYVQERYYGLWFRERSTLPDATSDRLGWLARMNRFTPQPYAQLAGVLRASGDTQGARATEKSKIDLEVKKRLRRLSARGLLYLPIRAIYRLLWKVFRVAFGYGLSPERATATVIVCLALGWIGTAALNARGYLVQNTTTSATLLATDSSGARSAAFPRAESHYDTTVLPCGSSINNLLYATDVFIPLLDLRQQSRCDIRALHAGDVDPASEWKVQSSIWHKLPHYLRAVFHAATLWIQLAKLMYAILGWVVISLAILTYSGTLRRWGEK
jgi:hypothetical protein